MSLFLPSRSNVAAFGVVVAAVLLSGCAAPYVTPGAGVNLRAIDDSSIRKRFETKAAAVFPARLIVVRVQEPGYYSYSTKGYGTGNYSIVTTRDVEKDEHFEKLASLPKVAGLGTLNRLLLPSRLESVKDLRKGAASLHADLLLVYTFDTSFRVKDKDFGPLQVISLGFLPNKKAYVTTTASAVLFGVRTGYVYGLVEVSHTTSVIANTWSTDEAVENTRIETETKAFGKLIDMFAETWNEVLKEYDK